jgi:hypothetical protein
MIELQVTGDVAIDMPGGSDLPDETRPDLTEAEEQSVPLTISDSGGLERESS